MNKKQAKFRALHNQIERLNGRLSHLLQQDNQLSQIRLGLFVVGALISGFLFLKYGPVVWIWGSMPAFLPFVGLVAYHRGIQTAVSRFTLWLQIKKNHLARMSLDWDLLPTAMPIPPRFDHPFALDVDLLGERSLHHLLDTAVSEEGSLRLREWLIEVAPQLDQILQRQRLVQELMTFRLFRDKLTLNAALINEEESDKKRWVGRQLVEWLHQGDESGSLRPLLLILSGLAVINITLFLLDANGILKGWWLLPWIIYVLIFSIRGGKGVSRLFQESTFLQNGLQTLNTVFQFLEQGRYGNRPHLRELCVPFLDEGERPSQHIKRVTRVVAGVGVRQNPLLGMLLNMIVPWDIYFAYRLQQCRQDLLQYLPTWLDVWYELEALNGLATFADLNPAITRFPELNETKKVDEPLFDVVEMGHPLIGDGQRVCNDYHLNSLGDITLITGSNMSGKSSFLRTIGVNLSLAYAGGVVMAHSMQTQLFRLYSSMRVNDSLVDGFSFFYAEVRRLQMLLQALEDERKRPLIFLIDEIFRGTNNRERLIGSRAYIRALADSAGVGIIATHDLELVSLADENPSIQNAHFRDDVQDGKMIFDYLLRSGPCPTTNALKIMRLAGLPVPIEDDKNE